MRLSLLLAVGIPTAALAAPAGACSVKDEYRVPTNLELAGKADVILLGEIESAPADIAGMDKPGMVIRTIEVLKGAPLPERIHLSGMSAPARFAVRSNPEQMEQAHPLAYIGGCIRYMFVPHSTVLFVLQRFEGELMPVASPFVRWAEDVTSADARWVKAMRLYVEAAALPEA